MSLSYFSPHLDGGKSLLQGGEFLVQALNAFACNVATLAQNFNERLKMLDQDIYR